MTALAIATLPIAMAPTADTAIASGPIADGPTSRAPVAVAPVATAATAATRCSGGVDGASGASWGGVPTLQPPRLISRSPRSCTVSRTRMRQESRRTVHITACLPSKPTTSAVLRRRRLRARRPLAIGTLRRLQTEKPQHSPRGRSSW